MAGTETSNIRDCAISVAINIFGLAYFTVFEFQLLIFHFPSSPEATTKFLSAICFGGGVIFWCLSSMLFRLLSAFQEESEGDWQKLEFAGALCLIYTTSIPSIALQFTTQPHVQMAYFCAMTLLFIGCLVEFLTVDSSVSLAHVRFPYYCIMLGLVCLVPTLHAIIGPLQNLPTFPLEFGQVVLLNAFAAVHYLIRPLERVGVAFGWRPSLCAMHLAMVYSAVRVSRIVLLAISESVS